MTISPWLDALHPRRLFLDTWREVDAEARLLRTASPTRAYDFRPLLALAVGAVCLLLMAHFGTSRYFFTLLETMPTDGGGARAAIAASPWRDLAAMTWWSGWRVLCYAVIPAMLIRFAWRERVRDFGLGTAGFARHAGLYAAAYLVALACIALVAFTDTRFTAYYPMYRLAARSWADLLAWEALYIAQFFALEFFFRGFWLNALRPSLGSQAIFVMVVPYAMIHIGKPLPEAFAAIVAGIFLGTLAMKTRSIWGGFLIHGAVALSMDIAALLATRGLPDRWWPASG